MKPWNKPIRFSLGKNVKERDKRFKENNRLYGITNWMVGTCHYPWSPWVQIHIGYVSIQIKWYLIALVLAGGAFLLGKFL